MGKESNTRQSLLSRWFLPKMHGESQALPVIAAGLAGVTAAFAALVAYVMSKPLYVFVIARRGHLTVLEAIDEIGGAAGASEVYEHLRQLGRRAPSAAAVLALLNHLTYAKLLHAVDGRGRDARYLLTWNGRRRLSSMRRA